MTVYEYAELFVDVDLQRIGIKFHMSQTAHSMKLSHDSGGRMISTTKLREYDWVEELIPLSNEDRRFIIETDESISLPTDGARYFISVNYRFESKRRFDEQGDYPELPGVYRLIHENRLVRIGESDDMQRRLKEHYREYADQVDEFDFAVIRSDAARMSEEKRMLNEYKDAYGSLPKLNLICA